ncbi:MAG TPA: lysozyme inhibitor LprI family protein [Rhodoblastus sp.]|nr:lysozyme inhibitor LprI family protein [Rhodoblastus sp.]
MVDPFSARVRVRLAGRLPAVLVLSASPVFAQSFDCSKAAPPIETAICASAALRAQDNALAGAYARAQYALREDAHALDLLKQAQRQWISARNRECARVGDKVGDCLTTSYATRLAEIGKALGAQQTAAQSQPVPAVQQAPAAQQAPAQPAPQAKPSQPVQPQAAAPAPPTSIATPGPQMQPATVPADRESSALVTIPAPGRYALRAESASGVALQLVDMMAGPGDSAGAAGARDGRLDVLLDKGVYKLRTTGAKGATKPATLKADVFHDVAAPAQLGADPLTPGDLGDLQQRSFWMDVNKDGRVAIEALGRALQDLRLWRDGEELADLRPDSATVETKAGRPMNRLRLEGKVEPGRYLATAYGGESAVWVDGATDKPFMIRRLTTQSVAAGLAEATVGAFGSLRFEAPADFDSFRLEVADPAPLRMTVKRGGERRDVSLAKNSRDPFVVATLPAKDRAPAIVEISGLEGQAFRLRALRDTRDLRIAGGGPTQVIVDVAGEGGDEIPATAILVRFDQNKARLVASDTPRIGPGQAWRRRFNLRGPSTILFEMTGPGPVTIRTQGPAARAAIEPVLGWPPPRADGRTPGRYDLEAGVYMLRLTPAAGATGVIDLTLGQPGQLPDMSPPPAPRTALSLGLHNIERGASYAAIANSAPGLLVGLRAVASPVDLSKGSIGLYQGLPAPRAASLPAPAPAAPQIKPATQQRGEAQPPRRPAHSASAPNRPPRPQPAGSTQPAPRPQPAQLAPQPAETAPSADIVLQARAPLGGAVRVRDQKGVDVAFSVSDEKTEKDSRVFTLRIPASATPRALEIGWFAPAPAPQPVRPRQPLQTIAAGAPLHFDLAEGQRREFRIEAKEGGLYRVETLGRLKTALTIGTNFLPRLGSAEDNGAGHNGLVQTYLRAGSYRVAVAAKDSSGRLGLTATPAEMITTGALSPGGSARATLSDGRGAITPIEIGKAGDYRLDLYALGRDLSARLEDADGWPLTAPGPLRSLEIKLEPGKYRLVTPPVDVDARMVARLTAITPDVALEGHGPHRLAFDDEQKLQWREPATKDVPRTPDVWTFALKGEAKIDLSISDGMIGDIIRGEKESVGKVTKDRPFSGKLGAGAYRVEARAIGRDDRLNYAITLKSDELQPDEPRFVDLPAKLDFAIAEDGVVNLTSFGRKDLKGVLRDANGAVVERLAGRQNDWNIAMSRRLPAGRYSLALSAMKAEAGADETPPETSDDDGAARAEKSDDSVEVRLALPAEKDAPALKADGAAHTVGANVTRFALPEAPAGALALVAARAASELVLSVERREPDGSWRVVGFERGQTPLVAWPAGTDKAQMRASVWSIDGADAPVDIVARAVTRNPQESASATLEPLALDAVGQNLRIGLARAASAAVVDLRTASDELYVGSQEGHALTRADAGALAPQSERLWFVARDAALDKIEAPAFAWTGEPIALALGSNESAILPAPQPAEGKARIWRAASAFGQPGLDAGRGMAVGDNVAAALAGASPLRVWNAGGGEPLRVDLESIDVTIAARRAASGETAILLPPLTAQPITLGGGDKKLDIDLAAGTAAFAAPGESDALALHAVNAALSRSLGSSASEIWLVNLTDKPQPVRLAATPVRMDSIALDRIARRFFGAAGSTSLHVDAQKGDVLRVEGAEATFVAKSGRVLRGSTLTLDGPGDVALSYQPGLVAAWLERAGASAWPKVSARAVTAPASLKLEGPAMAFALKQDKPQLIGVSTSAPVVVALEQNGARELKLYAAGADFRRYVAAGEATLTIYAPHDGSLGGALDLTSAPVLPAKEGMGDAVAVAPGASALFGFEVRKASEIGIGLRADPDRAEARLMDESGRLIGTGVSQIRKLAPGRYILEARMPADAPAATVQPALIGLDPPPAGPPPDEIAKYLTAAGLKPNAPTTQAR